MSVRPPFAEILASVADVEGWMTDDQARRLHDRAAELGAGTRIVEIGSFRGRSMIVLASTAADGVSITAIDPHMGSDRGPQEIEADQVRGDDDYELFHANLTAAGVDDRVTHVRKLSDAALDDVDGEIDLLYIDGAHRFAPARADIVQWGDRVSGGGTMLIHDSFSSIGVTLALLTTTFYGGKWRYVGRSQSMAEYQRVNLSIGERLRNALRQELQLPWFVRNVVIKVLIVAKLAPLTRLLGHRNPDEWPY
ncbi:MAG: class I SAM-dependent methyltransferase [Actinomycetota bacterium]